MKRFDDNASPKSAEKKLFGSAEHVRMRWSSANSVSRLIMSISHELRTKKKTKKKTLVRKTSINPFGFRSKAESAKLSRAPSFVDVHWISLCFSIQHTPPASSLKAEHTPTTTLSVYVQLSVIMLLCLCVCSGPSLFIWTAHIHAQVARQRNAQLCSSLAILGS